MTLKELTILEKKSTELAEKLLELFLSEYKEINERMLSSIELTGRIHDKHRCTNSRRN